MWPFVIAPLPIAQVNPPLLPADPNAASYGGGIEGFSNQLVDATSNLVAQGWDQTWTNVISGPLYGILARFGLMIAGFVIIFFVFQLARNMLEDHSNRPIAELIWPIVVVVFLSNNGALLGGLTLGMRNFINQQNSQILTVTSAGLNAQSALNRLANFQSAKSQLAALQNACDNIRDNALLESCLIGVREQADQIIQSAASKEVNGSWLGSLQTLAQQAISNPLQGLGNLAGATVRFISLPFAGIAQAILMASQAAFQLLVEASMLLTAVLGPIALGASLLPFGAKPIWAWLTAFWSVGLCKLSLNILTGLIAQATYQSGPTDAMGLIIPIALGILSPILAISMAAGGGMAIFNGLTSAATNVVSIATYRSIKQ
jgi:hypothetical protein